MFDEIMPEPHEARTESEQEYFGEREFEETASNKREKNYTEFE